MKFHEISETPQKYRFCGYPEVPGSSTLAISCGISRFREGLRIAENPKNMILIEIHNISEIFTKFHKFHEIPQISAALGPAALG